MVEILGLVQNARMVIWFLGGYSALEGGEETDSCGAGQGGATPLTAINADPEVMRWIGDGSVRNEQQTRGGIEAIEREWDAQGFGLFALEVRATGELAGFTGLSIPNFLPELLPA